MLLWYSFFNSKNTSDKTLWIIDNSLSMAVEDTMAQSGVIDSRLSLAKKIIITNSLKITGKQAIMSAAYWAKLEIPMTDNLLVLSDVVNGITPILKGWWSNLYTPLETMSLIYGDIPNLDIIWLTDGEFSDSGSSYTGKINTRNITFIGIGSKVGWPIPLWYNQDGKPRYKEVDGNRITSIRDDVTLEKIRNNFGSRLFFAEREKDIEMSDLVQKKSTQQFSLEMILWIILLLIWLMFPRYQYFKK